MIIEPLAPAQVGRDWDISFSTLQRAERCPRQVAYDRMENLRRLLKTPSLAGALGNVTHDLLSRYAAGNLEAEAFDRAWELGIDRARSHLSSHSIGPVPVGRTWPNYWLTYERLRLRLVGTVQPDAIPRRPPAKPQTPVGGQVLPFVERRLRDVGRNIAGTPDLVFLTDNGQVCVRDYKTGNQPSREAESAQLHLYAHLVSVETGLEVVFAEVDRLHGAPERQVIDPRLVEAVVQRACTARQRVVAGSTGALSAAICSDCSYRAICELRQEVPDASVPQEVAGLVEEVTTAGDGHVVALALETRDGPVVVGGLEGRILDVGPGQPVLVKGARRSSSGTGLLASWSTIVVTASDLREAWRSSTAGDPPGDLSAPV